MSIVMRKMGLNDRGATSTKDTSNAANVKREESMASVGSSYHCPRIYVAI